jgi:hypothetical protein
MRRELKTARVNIRLWQKYRIHDCAFYLVRRDGGSCKGSRTNELELAITNAQWLIAVIFYLHTEDRHQVTQVCRIAGPLIR